MIDRSKYYKEPAKFLGDVLWESEILSKINLEHWERFDKAVKSGKGFKVGDFINFSTELTAKQLVKFLDEFENLSLEEIREKSKNYIEELQKEIKL